MECFHGALQVLSFTWICGWEVDSSCGLAACLVSAGPGTESCTAEWWNLDVESVEWWRGHLMRWATHQRFIHGMPLSCPSSPPPQATS